MAKITSLSQLSSSLFQVKSYDIPYPGHCQMVGLIRVHVSSTVHLLLAHGSHVGTILVSVWVRASEMELTVRLFQAKPRFMEATQHFLRIVPAFGGLNHGPLYVRNNLIALLLQGEEKSDHMD